MLPHVRPLIALIAVTITALACMPSSSQPTPEVQNATDLHSAPPEAEPEVSADRILTYNVLPPGPQEDIEPITDHGFLFLEDEDPQQSVSIGTTRDGYLVGARPLPLPGHGYQVLPVQFERDLSYGTDEIIQAIIDAADAVAEQHPGSILYLGNIGNPDGGDIAWSVSHNNGRDADLAYFSTNPLGWQTRTPDFMHFRKRDRRSREYFGFYDFDVERSATLAYELFTHPDSDVQFMFAARHLTRPMMRELRSRDGLDPETLDRLDAVLYEPRSAAPHDDHLHLRIYCTRDDVIAGCQNAGRMRAWIDDYEDDRREHIQRVAELAANAESADQRAAAVARIGILQADHERNVVVAALLDPDPRVRARAAREIHRLEPTEGSVRAMISAYKGEAEDSVRCALVDGLSQIPTYDRGVRHLADALDDPGTCIIDGAPQPFPVAVARALEDIESSIPVEALVELLPDERPEVRLAAAAALHKLTNHDLDLDWASTELTDTEVREGYETWRRWYRRNRKKSRADWLVAGFKDQGFDVDDVASNADIPDLITAVSADPHISYNAQRALMAISDNYPPSLQWSLEDASWYWNNYFTKRQKKFGIRLR